VEANSLGIVLAVANVAPERALFVRVLERGQWMRVNLGLSAARRKQTNKKPKQKQIVSGKDEPKRKSIES
jgi:hypothetical protein